MKIPKLIYPDIGRFTPVKNFTIGGIKDTAAR